MSGREPLSEVTAVRTQGGQDVTLFKCPYVSICLFMGVGERFLSLLSIAHVHKTALPLTPSSFVSQPETDRTGTDQA